MGDTWNLSEASSSSKTKVVVRKDGMEKAFEFTPDTLVKDAFADAANATSLKQFVATDADGTRVQAEDGDEELGSFVSPIVLVPEAVGHK